MMGFAERTMSAVANAATMVKIIRLKHFQRVMEHFPQEYSRFCEIADQRLLDLAKGQGGKGGRGGGAVREAGVFPCCVIVS